MVRQGVARKARSYKGGAGGYGRKARAYEGMGIVPGARAYGRMGRVHERR